MHLSGLWLTDFRCYATAHLELTPGVSVIVGANGQGKTSLLEAIAWLATRRSFRGVPDGALVRAGASRAFARAEVVEGERRRVLEGEIAVEGRNRLLLDGHPVGRARDLADGVRVTVFAPDDLALVKGAPGGRRDLLDDLLVVSAPRYGNARHDYERILRQRNALLRGGLRGPDALSTLDVFDLQLARAGGELVTGRVRLLERLSPHLTDAYRRIAVGPVDVEAAYEAAWLPDGVGAGDYEDRLLLALRERRRAEQERGVTLSGPHRDDLRVRLDGMDTRSQSSQGEQRSLALALRLAGHRLATDLGGTAPVLLLDDVFSELDDHRTSALVEGLEGNQTLVTTAGSLPPGIDAQRVLHVRAGRVEEAA